jgi:hypothetical protein
MLLLATRIADYTVRRVFAVGLMVAGVAALLMGILVMVMLAPVRHPSAMILMFLLASLWVFLGRWLYRLKPISLPGLK